MSAGTRLRLVQQAVVIWADAESFDCRRFIDSGDCGTGERPVEPYSQEAVKAALEGKGF